MVLQLHRYRSLQCIYRGISKDQTGSSNSWYEEQGGKKFSGKNSDRWARKNSDRWAHMWCNLCVKVIMMQFKFNTISICLKYVCNYCNITLNSMQVSDASLNPLQISIHYIHYIKDAVCLNYFSSKTQDDLVAGIKRYWGTRITDDFCRRYCRR